MHTIVKQKFGKWQAIFDFDSLKQSENNKIWNRYNFP